MFGYNWLATHDGDPRAHAIMKRHYSYHRYADGRRENTSNPGRHLIAGPGEKMVLITPDCRSLFVWRKFKSDNGQQGVNCAVFHNESDVLASALILEAEQLAWKRWPGERLYTYVDGRKIKSANPGYCFIKAGWRRLPGRTKHNKLFILEKEAANAL